MKITKYEQSGFVLQNENGFKLALDIGNKTPVENLDGVNVDAMLVSHIHGDHFSLDQIKKISPKKLYLNEECVEVLGEEKINCDIEVVKVGDTIEIEGIKIKLFNVDHGPNVSAPLKENFGFIINIDGITVYFAGDMFYESGLDVGGLEVDYALIPVGTFYTFGPQEAFDFVSKFKRIGKIIPMHYDKKPETKDEFLLLTKSSFETE